MSCSPSPISQRVLVTGAGGFLGRHVVLALARAGHQVSAVDIRKMDFCAETPGVSATVIEDGDVSALRDAVVRSSAICHLAALVPRNMQDASMAAECFHTNALFSLRLAELAAECQVRRFVYCSSGQIYRYSETPVTEDAPVYPAARATYYLASKLVGELYIEHLRLTAGLPAVTLRLGNLYGPGAGDSSVVARFMAAAAQGHPLEVWDNGAPTYDLVYAPDIAKLIVAVVVRSEPGIYNAGSGQACSVMDLALAVADAFPDRRTEIIVKPPAGPMPASFSVLSIAKAARMWQYAPTPLSEALRLYRQYMEG